MSLGTSEASLVTSYHSFCAIQEAPSPSPGPGANQIALTAKDAHSASHTLCVHCKARVPDMVPKGLEFMAGAGVHSVCTGVDPVNAQAIDTQLVRIPESTLDADPVRA